jgi:hypothetical protein
MLCTQCQIASPLAPHTIHHYLSMHLYLTIHIHLYTSLFTSLPIGRVTALPEALDDAGEPIEVSLHTSHTIYIYLYISHHISIHIYTYFHLQDADPVEATPLLDAIKPEGWTFRVCPGGVGTAAGSVVVARSLVWPGAVAVTVGRKWVNIYVGSGLAYTATAYSPPLPAPIQVRT